ncbi:MAG: class II aldolase/adducin family protein [Oscillospiraceae bacterium]|nr:class II aldolase/adducin family protein [Oscillospiraceae bacterium]
MFNEKDALRMEGFLTLSHIAGSRADYVQGGGGNTSVKLEDGTMAIKASGFCLKDIEMDNAFALLDGNALRAFYREHNPEDFEDCEKSGAQCTKDNIKTIEGLPLLRPSVEAGFHSILKTYVLHTHSVYANLAACAVEGKEIAAKAFQNAPYSWGWVDYQDPGAKLAFAIRDEMARVEQVTGKVPAVILMQNHGIIVHDDDALTTLAIHADANVRLAAQFGLAENAFPAICVEELSGGVYRAATPYLKSQLVGCKYTQEQLITEPLYPDQMVFLTGTYFQDQDTIDEGQAVASTCNGELVMRMGAGKALTLTETLSAVFFIMEKVQKAGYTLSTMSDAARNFIANWESEKYRKSLGEKKK